MHKGNWETSSRNLECSACSDDLPAGTKYLLAKFSIKRPETNVSNFITLYLCQACIQAFEEYACSPEDVANLLNDNEKDPA